MLTTVATAAQESRGTIRKEMGMAGFLGEVGATGVAKKGWRTKGWRLAIIPGLLLTNLECPRGDLTHA